MSDPYNGRKPGMFDSAAKAAVFIFVLFAIATFIVWVVYG